MSRKEADEFNSEVQKITERYERRRTLNKDNPGDPHIISILSEKNKTLNKWIKLLPDDPDKLKLIEIGCGNGNNLLQLIKIGFNPLNLTANELLEDRVKAAKKNLPASIKLYSGNALELNLPVERFDVVYQSMVFSSILNKEFRFSLAKKMWEWVKPGGGILWYDFIYNNPFNKDVNGIPFKEIKQLFPEGKITRWKITLAPPLARKVCKINPVLYDIFNIIPLFRTHLFCWIKK